MNNNAINNTSSQLNLLQDGSPIKEQSVEYENQIVEEAMRILEKNLRERPPTKEFTTSIEIKRYLRTKLRFLEREQFDVIFLNAQQQMVGHETLFYGTIDGAAVYPREVVKAALRNNAAAVILAHNHPSGKAEPSHADRQITKRLVEACALVDVKIFDHIVVSDFEDFSFAERGLL